VNEWNRKFCKSIHVSVRQKVSPKQAPAAATVAAAKGMPLLVVTSAGMGRAATQPMPRCVYYHRNECEMVPRNGSRGWFEKRRLLPRPHRDQVESSPL